MISICLRRLRGRMHLFLPALTMLATATHAQTISLNDAIKKALDNYPLIQQRRAELQAEGAHIKTVTDHRLPSVILSEQVDAGTVNSMIGPYFSMGIVPSTSGAVTARENTNTASANIALAAMQLGIYQFGYYRSERREAAAAFAVGDAQLKNQEFLVTNNVVSLYLDWLKKFRLLQVQQQNMVRVNTIRSSIRANVLSGLKPGVDSSTANAESTRAYISYLQSLSSYENDKADLANYTGIDTALIKPDTSVISGSRLDRILKMAPAEIVPAAQPQLNVYELEYQQQLASNRVIAKKYLPKLSLQGAAWARGSSIAPNDTYGSLNDGLGYKRYNYLVGIAATYNITDLRQRDDQLAEGKYRADARKAAVQNEQANLNTLLLQANNMYTNDLLQLRTLPILLRSATDAYEQQLVLYRAGLNTLVDVTNALFGLQKAETELVLTQSELLQVQYLRACLSDQQGVFLETFK